MSFSARGSVVELLPTTLEHVSALWAAVAHDREAYRYTRVPEDEASMRAYVSDAIALHDRGEAIPLTVFHHGQVVGSTRFGHFERWDRTTLHAVEIGWTWYAASAFRTGANREAKQLMLTHAFESWQVKRVSLRTDSRNERSRNAIEALGAHYEGTSRAAKLAPDGTIRDTANYSILDREWPTVKARLAKRWHDHTRG